MKKLGNVQIVKLIFRPSVYTFDEITFSLIFNRILGEEDLQRAIGELGKEASEIRNVRVIAAQSGTPAAIRELTHVNGLVEDLTEIYNTIQELKKHIVNGSGTIMVGNTTLKFNKPRLVEFKDA